MKIDMTTARRVALILGLNIATFSAALADGRAVLPPRWMIDAYVSGGVVKPSRDDIARAIIPGLGSLMGFMAGGGFTPLAGSTTWNPSGKTAGITLSNGNLTAASDSSGPEYVKAIASKSSGSYYIEISVDVDNGPNGYSMGFADNASSTLATNGFTWRSNGNVWSSGGSNAAVAACTAGDIAMMAVDITNRLVYLGKNGSWLGSFNPSAGTGGFSFGGSGAISPWFNDTSNGKTLTANFGATPFLYSVPTGFTAGFN